MRFAGRRRAEGPAATYVGILDGQHLWLSLEADAPAELSGDQGSFALTGDVTDLLALLPPADATYAVMSGRRPVSVDPMPGDPVTRIPTAPDGLTQFEVLRDDAGHLHLRRQRLAPTAVLEAIEMRGTDVHLTLRPPGVEPGMHLLLLDADDEIREQLPVTAHDGHVEALVGTADLPGGYFGVLRLALGDDGAWVKIRRASNDLLDAHRAVLLPELHDPAAEADEDHPAARFRWNPDGLLVLRVLEPEGIPTAPEATVTPLPTAGREAS